MLSWRSWPNDECEELGNLDARKAIDQPRPSYFPLVNEERRGMRNRVRPYDEVRLTRRDTERVLGIGVELRRCAFSELDPVPRFVACDPIHRP